MPAFLTGAQIFTGIEVLEVGQEIGFDVFEFEQGFVQFVVAGITEPHQPIVKAFAGANALDDQTN